MEIRIKHETLPLEAFFTNASVHRAQSVISFIQANGIEVDGNATPLEYKSHGIVAAADPPESWLRIVVGPLP